MGAKGRFYAFEPFSQNVRNLCDHVRLNRLANVTVVQVAVAEGNGIAGFTVGENNAEGTILTSKAYLILQTSVDGFCARQTISTPEIVKIDVEGAERKVLEGVRHTLSKNRTMALLALHGRRRERECIAFLQALDYKTLYLDGIEISDEPLLIDEVIAVPRMIQWGANGDPEKIN